MSLTTLPQPNTGNPEVDQYLRRVLRALVEEQVRYPVNGRDAFVVSNVTQASGPMDPATVTLEELATIVATLLIKLGKSGILLTKET